MKEKTFALLTVFISAFSPALAQYADLLGDKNISWVAEYTADFSLNPVTYTFRFFTESEYEPNNDLNIIKLNIEPGNTGLYLPMDMERYFSTQIFKATKNGVFALFDDEALEIPVSQEEYIRRLTKIDTVVTSASDSFDRVDYMVISNELTAEAIVSFRVRQVFFYNKTEKKFGSRMIALSPLVDVKDSEGNFIETKSLIWIKIENPSKNGDKTIPGDLPYAFETKMIGNAPDFKGFALKKGRMDFLTMIVNEVAKPSRTILDSNFEPINPGLLQGFVQTIDTVTRRDPSTWEETTEIIQRNAIKDVERIGFVQQWFFDDRKKLFSNRVVAVAPLLRVKDAEGFFQYSKPLFYIMNE